jgi:type III restriction enzyme
METFWIPGVNNLKTYGRWAFAEFGDIWQIQKAFDQLLEQMIRPHGAAERAEAGTD